MADPRVTRREFVRQGTLAAAGLAAGVHAATTSAAQDDQKKILNHNPNMEYRPLGKTGLMVSAVCLGGHWKRVDKQVRLTQTSGPGWMGSSLDDPAFQKNRHEVVSRCIEVGINYVDACSGAEVLAYSKALQGRRDRMYFGYSWYEYEMRFKPWRESLEKMMEGLESGLRQAGLEYVDFWRISMEVDTGRNQTAKEVDIAMEALRRAKKQGKARVVGVSSHDRQWLQQAIETYTDVMEAVCTPYTARTKELPADSLFETVRKHRVGVFGIKPFASNSLFKGDSSPDSPHAEADDQLARLTIRRILRNTAVTAPIPGLVSLHQVDNVAKAVTEPRNLDADETARLDRAMGEAWARLPDDYQWLKRWDYV